MQLTVKRARWMCPRWLRVVGCLVVIVVIVISTGLVYRPVIQTGFFLADDHPLLRSASTPDAWSFFIPRPWILSGIRHPDMWRPLGTLSWRLNYLLTGPSPQAFYLVNLGFHLANAFLLALLALRLRRGDVVALTAAAVFALHPMATETVSWLASRFDLLATAASLLSLLGFLESRRRAVRGAWWMLGAVFAFFIAVFSKESAVVVPLLAVAIDVCEAGSNKDNPRLSARLARSVTATFPLWAALGVFLVVRTADLGALGGYADYLDSGPKQVLENLLYHSRMIFFVPFDQDAYVARNAYMRPDLAVWMTAVPLLVVVALAVVSPGVRFGLAFVLISILPVVTVNGGGRLVYLALIGYALIVGEIARLAIQTTIDRVKIVNPIRKTDDVIAKGSSLFILGLISMDLIAYARTGYERNGLWSQAGELVRGLPNQVISLYPGLPGGAIVYARGLPDQWQEVYVFRNVSAIRFDVNGLTHQPNLSDAAWHQPSFAEIVPVTSFPSSVPVEEACRTYFAQYETKALTWQPVPIQPSPKCRPTEDTAPLEQFVSTPYTFENSMKLAAFQLLPSPIVAGQQVQIDLVWQAGAPIPQNYKTFIHISKGDSPPVAQRDAEPYDGRYPTSVWTPGEVLRDRNRITIPANLPAGRYDVLVGLYSADSLNRVTAFSGGIGIGDHVRITTIEVLGSGGG